MTVTVLGQTPDYKRTSVRLGDNTVIIPAPDGFEEAAAQFETIKQRMSATEDPGNDMLLVHLPHAQCETLRGGESVAFDVYTKVSIRKENRTRVETAKDFADLVAQFRQSGASALDVNSPRMKATLERLDKTVSDLNKEDAKFEMAQPVNLGEIDTRPNVYSVLLSLIIITEQNGSRVVQPILGGLSFVRVNERLLFVYTYRNYNSKADIEAIQSFTKNWITKILAAN